MKEIQSISDDLLSKEDNSYRQPLGRIIKNQRPSLKNFKPRTGLLLFGVLLSIALFRVSIIP